MLKTLIIGKVQASFVTGNLLQQFRDAHFWSATCVFQPTIDTDCRALGDKRLHVIAILLPLVLSCSCRYNPPCCGLVFPRKFEYGRVCSLFSRLAFLLSVFSLSLSLISLCGMSAKACSFQITHLELSTSVVLFLAQVRRTVLQLLRDSANCTNMVLFVIH